MAAKPLSAYLSFVHGTAGAAVVVALSILACALTVAWARRGSHRERWPVLIASSTLTSVVVLVYAFAVAAGWWSGEYFSSPLIVQIATLVPLSIASLVAWLLGYGWLADHIKYPLLVYAGLALLLVAAVAAADRAEFTGGLLLVADDGATWIDALIGVCLMFTPVLLFEGMRRALDRDALP